MCTNESFMLTSKDNNQCPSVKPSTPNNHYKCKDLNIARFIWNVFILV